MTEHRVLGRIIGDTVRASPRGTFDALAVSYGTLDDYKSVWLPGVFDESLGRRLPSVCWNHDWSDAIGRITAWRATDQGPVLTGQLDVHPDVPRARQAAVQLASGTIRDVSVGFSDTRRRDPTDTEAKRWPGCREVIEQATLDELSLVLAGAVPGAQVLAGSVRSRAQLARDLARGRITADQYRAAAGTGPAAQRALNAEALELTDAEIDEAIEIAHGRRRWHR